MNAQLSTRSRPPLAQSENTTFRCTKTLTLEPAFLMHLTLNLLESNVVDDQLIAKRTAPDGTTELESRKPAHAPLPSV